MREASPHTSPPRRLDTCVFDPRAWTGKLCKGSTGQDVDKAAEAAEDRSRWRSVLLIILPVYDSDVNKDWTCKDKDKDKDQAYKEQDKDKD